jgi:23S rRNA G2445 N2-methylase RlmL
MKKPQHNEPVPRERPYLCEAEVVPGLEKMAAQEIATRFVKAARLLPDDQQVPGAVRFRYRGDLLRLQGLRLAQAVYLTLQFDVPRPKALLSNQNLRIVNTTTQTVRELFPKNTFKTLHIDAAGSDTAVMQRFQRELETATQLKSDNEAGDLWLRLKRIPFNDGWELLIRIGNRPLATRAWRTCNYEGALNATVAHAMSLLSQPKPTDNIINLGSGSGSLLIERAAWGPSNLLLGIDNDSYAIQCGTKNARAASVSQAIFTQGNLKKLPLRSNTANVLLADLPFGQLTGSHNENIRLYPETLSEAARIATPEARFIIITHEIRLMESVLAASQEWQAVSQQRITLRGLHPRIYVLTRKG